MLEVVADTSFLTEPVSCEVSNAVGSVNCSTALDVQCEPGQDHDVGKVGPAEMARWGGGWTEWGMVAMG